MKLPIHGMKAQPIGEDYMFDAWFGCVIWAANDKNCQCAFKEKTTYDITSLIGRNGIEIAIDKVSGYEKSIVIAFCDWVTENIWGKELDSQSN